ncbi:MAG TPA: EpsD family peptidyl-prolyl cis-trans isomerase [Usitatibacter sp.]|jgi:EpsD family peptidyl-prolyl cis-trans isomerase|nr:EpsD family peptidyl-prolyl cis-trans isomerase [Usitatibacter sp.]
MSRSAILRIAAVAALLAAPACSRDPASASGVAARVNGGDVPLARVATALARDGGGAKDAPRALESAIDEELLVQKALAARLDRDPDVARAVEEDRRRILARAWLDRSTAAGGEPDRAQVHAFYEANPALFGARRIYALRELRLVGSTPRAAALRAVAAANDADAVEAWLAREGVRFEAASRTEAAEAVPLALLARLQSMKDGEIAVIDADGAAGPVVVELMRSIAAPLGEAEAAPVIARFLAARRRLELAREEIARLRSAARIEYLAPVPTARGAARPAVPVHAALQTSAPPSLETQVAATAGPPRKDEKS